MIHVNVYDHRRSNVISVKSRLLRMKVVQNNADEMMNSPLLNKYRPSSDSVTTMSRLKKCLLVFICVPGLDPVRVVEMIRL